MRKLLGAIFGSSKNTETIVNGAVAGLDKMFYTNEEKAEGMEKMREWYLRYLEATQPQNLSRRLIAVAVVGLWAFLVIIATAVYRFDPDYGQFVFEVIDENVNLPFGIIIGFYFAAHVIRQLPGNGKQ